MSPVLAVRRGFRPLAVRENGLVGYENGSLVLVDFDLTLKRTISKIKRRHHLPILFSRFRLIERVFRLGPSAAAIHDDKLFVAHRDEIVLYDLSTGRSEIDFVVPGGRGILSFGKITLGGAECLAFGEYFANPSRHAVGIWIKKNYRGSWVRLASFSDGEIEHVHSIQQIDGRVLVLSGDFDSAAGIWELNPHNATLSPLCRGRQTYRSCWIHSVASTLLFATDTQLEANSLQSLNLFEGAIRSEKLADLPGSSIYSTCDGEKVIFSSAVEPGYDTGFFLRDILETTPGPGIKGNHSTIFIADSAAEVRMVLQARKDWLPMRLAQFGTFLFPAGAFPSDRFFAFGQAVDDWDGCCLAISTRRST